MYACSLVCASWEPVASDVLWEAILITSDNMFAKLAFGSFCSSLRRRLGAERAGCIRFLEFTPLDVWRVCRPLHVRFFETLSGLRALKLNVGDSLEPLVFHILPRLNVSSARLSALDIIRPLRPVGNYAHAEEIASTLARLKFLRVPPMISIVLTARPLARLLATVGPNVRYLALDSDLAFPTECINFLAHFVSAAVMDLLASLRTPLRRVTLSVTSLESESSLAVLLTAITTIRELNLRVCQPLTDATLVVLEKHPPLHYLHIAFQPTMTASSIVSFLHARGSELRFLGLDWHGPAPFAAISSHARNIEHIPVSLGCLDPNALAPASTRENVQFVKELVLACRACKRLRQCRRRGGGADRVHAFLVESGLRHGYVDPFDDGMDHPGQFAGVGL
ncbi:hypothetical protein BDK51DRAFT_27906 [Blyttiomyces helicus]|uniref:F-box domain-containing protein n=1 Tax=Blyttiomyces helicus TaxID=388810 RepID=A0A4P9WI01_9FUNG|nr:hypothetical protein BDK51DRAFT_27906 [Blyttiomyces helicus]|eukprot:RKO92479.1 hypothetical protein BDK51DRAFT_27906 [Blyttiomyces helicus]